MKERIQEALRRRHRKGDEGFTLIDLLVVILIIAILAAVGIVALLAALNSGRKSSATTVANSAAISVKALQTSNSTTDYAGIDAAAMDAADPDLNWTDGAITATGNEVSLAPSATSFVLATRSDRGVCYYIRLLSNPTGTDAGTMYASSNAGQASCDAANPVLTNAYNRVRRDGFAG